MDSIREITFVEESNSSDDDMSYDEDDETEAGPTADHYESLVSQYQLSDRMDCMIACANHLAIFESL